MLNNPNDSPLLLGASIGIMAGYPSSNRRSPYARASSWREQETPSLYGQLSGVKAEKMLMGDNFLQYTCNDNQILTSGHFDEGGISV